MLNDPYLSSFDGEGTICFLVGLCFVQDGQ